MCDEIFERGNFRNEIVWIYRRPSAPGQRQWGRMHDVLLFYTKGKSWTFNADEVRLPYAKSSIERQGYASKMFGGIPKQGVQKLHPKGKFPEDWLDIPIIRENAKERLGYPTQKPEALLERIIRLSSNPMDLVLDCFCACGTTLTAAHRSARRWLGIDVSPTGCKLVQYRLSKLGVRAEIIGLPRTIEELKQLNPMEFQNWVIGAAGGRVSDRKSRDMGIDGYTFYGLYGEKEYPIAVKRMDKVGRIWVDNFETAMRRKSYNKGYIVAFDFTKDSYEEVARAKSQEGLDIELVKVEEIKKRFLEGFMETLKGITRLGV